MMPALQYLRHGKALCGKVFKRFVETFNYHNDFIANLKGDGDLPMSDGCILLDLTDPKHPVIRFNKQNLDLTPGGGSGLPDLSCFCIKPSPKQEDNGAPAFCNCFVSDGMVFEQVIEDGSYRVDQFVLQGELEEGREYSDDDRPYVYVQFYGGDHDINAQKTLEDVREIAKDQTQGTVLLLYKLKHDGSVAIDFRNMPIFQHVEAV